MRSRKRAAARRTIPRSWATWKGLASRWRTTSAASTSSSTAPSTRSSMARSGRSRWSPTRRIAPRSGRVPDITPPPIAVPPRPRNECAAPAVAPFARLSPASLGESLSSLADRDLLGPARRADRIRRLLELRLASSHRDAPVYGLGRQARNALTACRRCDSLLVMRVLPILLLTAAAVCGAKLDISQLPAEDIRKGVAVLGENGDFLWAFESAKQPTLFVDDQRMGRMKRSGANGPWTYSGKLKTGTSTWSTASAW